jgi:hypothetical protein
MIIAIANVIGKVNSGISYVKKLIKSFKERVLADGGVFEAEACLENQLSSLQGIGLLDDASLLVTPNAYKASVLYDIVPNTTLGDLGVVRATSATRVDANGLVEIPRTNLILQSQTFENASWSKINSSVIANTVIAPDGTMTADSIINNVGNNQFSRLRQIQSAIIGQSYSFSCFIKKGNTNFCNLTVFDGANFTAYFNIDDGNIGTLSSGITADIIPYEDNWYKCTLNRVASSTSLQFIISPCLIDNSNVSNLNDFIYLWGAQLETGLTATEYIPTVASIRTKFAGITQDGSSASNIPRLDYTNSSCPSILVEPQRTNLVTYSEQFDNANWEKSIIGINTSIGTNGIESNVANAPSGTLTADRVNFTLQSDLDLGLKQVYASAVATQSFVASIYVKGEGSNIGKQIKLRIKRSIGGSFVSVDTTITLTSDWVRITSSALTLLASNTGVQYIISSNDATNALIWGAQLEAGANATSYIPTVAASVTRNADVISKTGISSLIGQTEGTIFFDIQTVNTENIKAISIGSVDFNNYMYYYESSNNYYFIIVSGGVTLTLPFTGPTLPSRKKIALRYSQNNFSMWINGVKRVEKLEVFNPPSGLNKMQFVNPFNQPNTVLDSKINSVLLFKTALSNTELSQITTL